MRLWGWLSASLSTDRSNAGDAFQSGKGFWEVVDLPIEIIWPPVYVLGDCVALGLFMGPCP